MFGSGLDIEHPFGHDASMGRTCVRRRRLVALCAAIGLVGVLSGPVAHAVGVGGSAEAKRPRTYVVRPGDTLWAIAKRHYGAGSRYRSIHAANRRLRSPHSIHACQRVYLPPAVRRT